MKYKTILQFPKWIWAVSRLYFAYHNRRMLFSKRLAMLLAARHRIEHGVVDYPNAFFYMTPDDAKRGIAMAFCDPSIRRSYLDLELKQRGSN